VWNHLSHPIDDAARSDHGPVISGGLFEAGCDATELLELAEAAFHKIGLGIELLVERIA
jgi:hypothetical protein